MLLTVVPKRQKPGMRSQYMITVISDEEKKGHSNNAAD